MPFSSVTDTRTVTAIICGVFWLLNKYFFRSNNMPFIVRDIDNGNNILIMIHYFIPTI